MNKKKVSLSEMYPLIEELLEQRAVRLFVVGHGKLHRRVIIRRVFRQRILQDVV